MVSRSRITVRIDVDVAAGNIARRAVWKVGASKKIEVDLEGAELERVGLERGCDRPGPDADVDCSQHGIRRKLG